MTTNSCSKWSWLGTLEWERRVSYVVSPRWWEMTHSLCIFIWPCNSCKSPTIISDSPWNNAQFDDAFFLVLGPISPGSRCYYRCWFYDQDRGVGKWESQSKFNLTLGTHKQMYIICNFSSKFGTRQVKSAFDPSHRATIDRRMHWF